MRDAVPQRLQRAVGAAAFACLAHMAFRLVEERKAIGKAPSGIAELSPLVIVGFITAEIHHPIDGAGTADHLAARQVKNAVAKMLLRLAAVAPVESAGLHEGKEPGRHANER